MGMLESLTFPKRGTNFGEYVFFYSIFTHLSVLIAATLSDLFDTSIIKTLVIQGFTI